METYPTEWKQTPYPVIATLGSNDLSTPIIQLLRIVNEEYLPKLHFLSHSIEYRFQIKKIIPEKHATFPQHATRDFDSYQVQGILKSYWMKKHHEIIPSCVLIFHAFDPRLSLKDWQFQEIQIREDLEQIKRSLIGRECRTILILVQLNVDEQLFSTTSTQSIQTLMDERFNALRKKLETSDGKNLILLKLGRDLTRQSQVIIKLEATIRNYALEYYKAQCKRVKRYKKALGYCKTQSANTLAPLHVRFSMKTAHYYEFRRYTTKVIQHYETAYKAVLNLPLVESTIPSIMYQRQEIGDNKNGINYTQVMTIAEYIHFKLCYHLIFSSNNIKAAVDQLHRHINFYRRLIVVEDRAYEHWAWVSRQYHVFAQLLTEAHSIRGSNSINFYGLDSETYQQPYLYYSIAAKYAAKRRQVAEKRGLKTSSGPNNLDLNSFVVVPSVYIGGDPTVSLEDIKNDDILPNDAQSVLVQYFYALERSVPHAKLSIHLLEQALHHLAMCITKTSIPVTGQSISDKGSRIRLKSRLLAQLGTESLAAGVDLHRSRRELSSAKSAVSLEGWHQLTASLLGDLRTCALHMNDSIGFVNFSMQLLSHKLRDSVQESLRKQIQMDLTELLIAMTSNVEQDNSQKQSTEFIVDMSPSRSIVDVKATFDHEQVILKQNGVSINVTLLSHFPLPIRINVMDISFSDSTYDIRIIHSEEQHDLEELSDDNLSCPTFGQHLLFMPLEERAFTIPLCTVEKQQVLQLTKVRLAVQLSLDKDKNILPTFNMLKNFLPPSTNETQLQINDSLMDVKQLETELFSPKSKNVPLHRPHLMQGQAPDMGRGPGSPSFADGNKSVFFPDRRKSLGKSSSGINDNDEPPPELDPLIKDQLPEIHIVEPQAQARITLISPEVSPPGAPIRTLTNDFRILHFRLYSNSDHMTQVSYQLSSDINFYSNTNGNPSIFYSVHLTGSQDTDNVRTDVPTPLEIDEASGQPLNLISLPDLIPESHKDFAVCVRVIKSCVITMSIRLNYTTKEGVIVHHDRRYEIICQDPFTSKSWFVHDLPTPASSSPTLSAATAYVGKPVTLKSLVSCVSKEEVQVISIQLIHLDTSVVERIDTSNKPQSAMDVSNDDSISTLTRLLPKKVQEVECMGYIQIQWKRHSSQLPFESRIVTTELPLPILNISRLPITVSMKTPAYGIVGQIVPLTFQMTNNESYVLDIKVKCINSEDSTKMLIAGRTTVIESLLPYETFIIPFSLVPTTTGYVPLPQFEILSITTNLPLIHVDEHQAVFIQPLET